MRESDDKLIEQAFLAGYLVEATWVPGYEIQTRGRLYRPPKIIEVVNPTDDGPMKQAYEEHR
jgi:hypothetical protein